MFPQQALLIVLLQCPFLVFLVFSCSLKELSLMQEIPHC